MRVLCSYRCDRRLLGAKAYGVGSILNVESGDDKTIVKPYRCTDLKSGVGGVAVQQSMACLFQELQISFLKRSLIVDDLVGKDGLMHALWFLDVCVVNYDNFAVLFATDEKDIASGGREVIQYADPVP